MTKLRVAIMLLALAVTSPELRHFRYERTVNGAGAQAGQTCSVVDTDLYEHAAPDLADVRLYRGQGRNAVETPYAIWQAPAVAPPTSTMPPLNLGRKGSHTTFMEEMPEGKYSDVHLAIGTKDFVATVAVTGAQTGDGRQGTELGLYTIFDLTAQKLGRSTVLHLPESNFRYLYFDIQGPVKPEDVHGLTAERVPATLQYVTVAATSQTEQKGHDTILRLEVPAHVPVERVEFLLGAEPKNFSRNVMVRVHAVPAVHPKTDEPMAAPAETSGTLLRLHTVRDGHPIDEEQLTVDAPRVDYEDASQWTITIDNGDDVPLSIESVRLEMTERKLCFDAAAGATYTVMYGDAALSAPHYDYATLFAPDAHAAVATIGSERANPDYAARPDTRAFTERHPALLWIALLVVVVVLGGVAFRTARSGALRG